MKDILNDNLLPLQIVDQRSINLLPWLYVTKKRP
jgi:hypothetical protein